MADDGESSSATSSLQRLQHNQKEAFQGVQETQPERKFPVNPGIVPLPPGSRGPRSLYIKRCGDSFGFTLRHFIVYPPESISEDDGRCAAVGALSAPMETIFVKHIKESGQAKEAGLRQGDRIIAVNGIPLAGKSYAEVVQLISHSPEYIHLLVVPKEEDVLQKFFADTAYNPASNKPQPEKERAKQLLSRAIREKLEFRADPVSWRNLRPEANLRLYERGQRSAENLLDSRRQQIYAEIHPHEIRPRQKTRAQPQVPLYSKMGRRASDGNALSENYYDPALRSAEEVFRNPSMKAIYKPSYHPDASQNRDMLGLNYPNSAGCRLSLDASRRESISSLNSSITEGSKDYIYDSASTLTGHETDDSAIISRMRRSVQQKEEFLRMPSSTVEHSLIQREFYGRPKKLEKQQWPPESGKESPSRTNKPIHQNFLRVKNDIDNERDLTTANQQQKGKVSKDRTYSPCWDKIPEATSGSGYEGDVNGTVYEEDEERAFTQVVQKRTKDFESGKPLPEDDPSAHNREQFSRSELSRLSSKKLVPNVTEIAQDYESRAMEPRRDNSGTSTNSTSTLKRIQRDSRSLDSSGSNTSSSSVNEVLQGKNKSLSGNVTISSGSKYIHCPPPSEQGKPTDTTGYEAIGHRVRSNSAESWVAALGNDRKQEQQKRYSRHDALTNDQRIQKAFEPMDTAPHYAEVPILIPEPVERMQLTPLVSITPAPGLVQGRAARPTQLDLEGPVRPLRHLKPPPSNVDTPVHQPPAPANSEEKPVVVKRRVKNTNLADDERTMRRESYLKATKGDRMQFDSDHSDGDVSPQVLRSSHRRWRPPMFPGDIQQLRKLFEDAASSLGGSASGNSSSSASLEREKASPSEKDKYHVIKEGTVHCKILEIDGKRAADRSWKQVWAVLRGPKLFLYKSHQSPIANSDVVEQSLSSGVDMRTSVVRVAEDYTKRKNVFRVSSVKPCRSEFLLQTEEFGDWVTVLQEQVATTTEAEAKLDPLNAKQLAVPQAVPASSSIQVQGSHFSPQLNAKPSSSRNRSPTGQSPVSKTRKPSQITDPSTSPKSKTWRGRMVKQFRKIQGASSPSSPTAPEVSTFGIPIDHCLPSLKNPYIPRIVEFCTEVVEERGLQTIGIYRVPGNNASITGLTDEINKNYDELPVDDPRWNDVHVVSSLLKSFFRKMPESLITYPLYSSFIKADKIEDPRQRMIELRRLVKSLPHHNYQTLKHIMEHLNKVVQNSNANRMEAKNLAIVFGPTIIRSECENMESMVHNMTNQCKIIETLLINCEWFFSDSELENVPLSPPPEIEEFDAGNNQALLENIVKFSAMKEPKEKLLTSLISAAHRKVKKATKAPSKESEPVSPTGFRTFNVQPFTPDLKENSVDDSKDSSIPTTVTDLENRKPAENVTWYNYQTGREDFQMRVERFKQETVAMIQRPRPTEISVNNIDFKPTLSSSASNVNQSRLSMKPNDVHLLTKTHSASNVFSRTIPPPEKSRNSLNSMDNQYTQYGNKLGDNSFSYNTSSTLKPYSRGSSDVKKTSDGLSVGLNDVTDGAEKKNGRPVFRRGSSVESINTSSLDLTLNGNMKKLKYENDAENPRGGSLESLNKLQDDDADLVMTMTKLYDQKLKEENKNILAGDDLPFVDESPVKHPPDSANSDKENIPRASDLYKNPSLHKGPYSSSKKKEELKLKESNIDKEKDEDTMTIENVPDNERHISTHNKLTLSNNSNKINSILPTGSRLKRSESLNKPERTVSPLNVKLKRSESLNKTGDKLKRSDSLTKNEKTESNNNKRRENSFLARRTKENAKWRRKNGMPDRSIKRRHTVGGTKDPDKITWFDDKYQEEFREKESKESKEKSLRTSSPDLSSARREHFFIEFNLLQLDGARPQSFPESTVFKIPLESHV